MSVHSSLSSPTSRPDDAFTAEAQIGRYLRLGAAVILLLVVGLGGWSAVTSIEGAVVASGLVAAESDSRSVQHLNGGVITDILVRDGDRVKAGDVLILRADPRRLEDFLGRCQLTLVSGGGASGVLTESVVAPRSLLLGRRITSLYATLGDGLSLVGLSRPGLSRRICSSSAARSSVSSSMVSPSRSRSEALVSPSVT